MTVIRRSALKRYDPAKELAVHPITARQMRAARRAAKNAAIEYNIRKNTKWT